MKCSWKHAKVFPIDIITKEVLLEHDHLEHRYLGQDTPRDGALGRGGPDSGHDIGREEGTAIGEAVERLDRVDDAALAVVPKRLDLTTFIGDLELVQVVAKVQSILQTEENGLTVKHRLVNVYHCDRWTSYSHKNNSIKFDMISRSSRWETSLPSPSLYRVLLRSFHERV